MVVKWMGPLLIFPLMVMHTSFLSTSYSPYSGTNKYKFVVLPGHAYCDLTHDTAILSEAKHAAAYAIVSNACFERNCDTLQKQLQWPVNNLNWQRMLLIVNSFTGSL